MTFRAILDDGEEHKPVFLLLTGQMTPRQIDKQYAKEREHAERVRLDERARLIQWIVTRRPNVDADALHDLSDIEVREQYDDIIAKDDEARRQAEEAERAERLVRHEAERIERERRLAEQREQQAAEWARLEVERAEQRRLQAIEDERRAHINRWGVAERAVDVPVRWTRGKPFNGVISRWEQGRPVIENKTTGCHRWAYRRGDYELI